MSLISKVKNFFYEDVEEEVEEVKKVSKPKKEKKIDFKAFIGNDEEQEVKETVKAKPQINNDLSERELLRSERTFNFPMDLGDEIFDEEEKKPVVKEEKKIVTPPKREVPKTYSSIRNTSSIYQNISKEEPKKEEKTRFRPSPVISPVYGILDKNYTVDDVIEKDLNKTKEFSIEKKELDFDTVRNRAYKELDEEIERTLTGNIFYNLDDDKIEEKEEVSTSNDDIFDNDEPVIITYNDEEDDNSSADEIEFTEEKEEAVSMPDLDDSLEESYEEEKDEISYEEEKEVSYDEEESDDDLMPDVKIEPKKATKAKKETKSKKKEVKEEKEDLFNLIDNMYNDEDDEEEDE